MKSEGFDRSLRGSNRSASRGASGYVGIKVVLVDGNVDIEPRAPRRRTLGSAQNSPAATADSSAQPVLPTARALGELGAGSEAELAAPEPVVNAPRTIVAEEHE
jgi:hypothetical protein